MPLSTATQLEIAGMALASVVDGIVRRHGRDEFDVVIKDMSAGIVVMEEEGRLPVGYHKKFEKDIRDRWLLP